VTTDRSSARTPTRGAGNTLLNVLTGIAAGVALQAALPAASAQEYELVPPSQSGLQPGAQLGAQPAVPDMIPAGRGISMRAQIDVLYTPPGATAPILVQKAIETRSAAVNLNSQYVFDVLNNAVLAGVDQALAGGAQTGRISVVAVCYTYDVGGVGDQALAPMGVFINTTDLDVLPNGHAALRTNVKVIPPLVR